MFPHKHSLFSLGVSQTKPKVTCKKVLTFLDSFFSLFSISTMTRLQQSHFHVLDLMLKYKYDLPAESTTSVQTDWRIQQRSCLIHYYPRNIIKFLRSLKVVLSLCDVIALLESVKFESSLRHHSAASVKANINAC